MAAILPDLQQFVDLRNGTIVGIHLVTPVSSSDTFTVPDFASTTATVSVATLRRADGNTATVTSDGANTVTVVGTAGSQVLIASAHNFINSGAES